MQSPSDATIIIVDDDELVNSSLRMALEKLGYSSVSCYNAADFDAALDTADADMTLMDVHLGETTGIDLLEQIRSRGIVMPVVMITGYGDIKMAVRAMKAGAEDFILKPITIEQLEVCVQKALRVKGLTQEVQRLREELSGAEESKRIIGTSKAIKQALSLADKFALSDDTTVLLQGESGTGKELFAHYIHYHSKRAANPLIIVDCTAIPKDLAENELFGHERGAYTGATEKLKKGKFELAQNGTIFLDEVNQLTPAVQAKLLRVIESKKFYRLGGTNEVTADVRIIAATNRNLADAVEDGSFRQDLFYRLDVGRIVIPPLRERDEDILVIANAFVEYFNAKFHKRVLSITPGAGQILKRHPWKGNVRELRNVIERVMLVDAEDAILPEHLRMLIGATGAVTDGIQPDQAENYVLKIPGSGKKLDDIIREVLLQTLRNTNGNQTVAAKMLGMTRAKFRYRLEQLGILTQSENMTLFK